MRATLLASVIEVCSAQDGSNTAVIDDVIRHAGVSRGTFYKYFQSLEEAVREVAVTLADEMADALRDFCRLESDPVMPLVMSFQLFLQRARRDHAWGGFVVHIGLLNGQARGIARGLRGDLNKGALSGDFKLQSIETAVDMVIGTLVEAVMRIIEGDYSATYIQDITELVLRGLGLSPRKATSKVQRAHQELLKRGPVDMPWWEGQPVRAAQRITRRGLNAERGGGSIDRKNHPLQS